MINITTAILFFIIHNHWRIQRARSGTSPSYADMLFIFLNFVHNDGPRGVMEGPSPTLTYSLNVSSLIIVGRLLAGCVDPISFTIA